MKKILTILACLVMVLSVQAQQQEQIYIHSNGSVIYQNGTSNLVNMLFNDHSTMVNTATSVNTFDISAIDSITFGKQELPPPGDVVSIIFNGNDVQIDNPYSSAGVIVTHNNADVTITSTLSAVVYRLSGASQNGSVSINSNDDFTLQLYDVNLSSTTKAAIDITTEVDAEVILTGESSLSDAADGEQKGAFCSAGSLTFIQDFGTLNIHGNKKHGINTEGAITLGIGNINIISADNDGIHCRSFAQAGGSLVITETGSDGIDCSDNFSLVAGELRINTAAEDINAIKADYINITDGILDIEHSGDVSKGLKADSIAISGGDITIVASGSTILTNENGQQVPSYCTAMKAKDRIAISGGTFNITLPTSNHGGKSISSDGSLSITGGDFTILTQGDGEVYVVSGSTKDSYTSSCLKSEGPMEILAGTLSLTSTGRGAKGISSSSTLVIGLEGANDEDLILDVTTSGERLTITAGGGGPWGGGGDYANPKAIKAMSNLTINSGTITVNCTQTQNEGGECIESKDKITINGGIIEAYSRKDDAVNAAHNITFNGGTYYAHSDGNDGTDSNGTFEFNGGFLISAGARSPEEGFDCDNNQFKVTGGTFVGTGGGTSNPTQNVCTQPTLKLNTQPGYAIQVIASDGEVIVTFQCPEFTGGGGGFPGWGNSMVMLFSDPRLQTGQSYTVKYGGTITGGTNINGYVTGNDVIYSGGDTTTANINSMLTTVSAGGNGGW